MSRWKNRILNPLVMFLAGLASGFIVKEIDIHFYAQHFGISLSEIFSQAGVWVLIGVAISLSAETENMPWPIFLHIAREC